MDIGDWPQCVIEVTDRQAGELVAVERLRPGLATAQANGSMNGWWFIRKSPFWRLRYRPATPDAGQDLGHLLDDLVAEDLIVGWTPGIYEPEVAAFGGTAGTDVAHELFHHDSRNILDYLAGQATAAPDTPELGRRELAVLLFSVLMRAAGLDWYEQGDVWDKVAQHRTELPALPAERHASLSSAVHRLMTVDAGPTSALVDGGPLVAISDWSAGFDRAGQRLAGLVRSGTLERGLRAVLAHHAIFFFNRLGLSYAEQSTLAILTTEVIMGERGGAVSAPWPGTGRTTGAEMDTQMIDKTSVTRRACAPGAGG